MKSQSWRRRANWLFLANRFVRFALPVTDAACGLMRGWIPGGALRLWVGFRGGLGVPSNQQAAASCRRSAACDVVVGGRCDEISRAGGRQL